MEPSKDKTYQYTHDPLQEASSEELCCSARHPHFPRVPQAAMGKVAVKTLPSCSNTRERPRSYWIPVRSVWNISFDLPVITLGLNQNKFIYIYIIIIIMIITIIIILYIYISTSTPNLWNEWPQGWGFNFTLCSIQSQKGLGCPTPRHQLFPGMAASPLKLLRAFIICVGMQTNETTHGFFHVCICMHLYICINFLEINP